MRSANQFIGVVLRGLFTLLHRLIVLLLVGLQCGLGLNLVLFKLHLLVMLLGLVLHLKQIKLLLMLELLLLKSAIGLKAGLLYLHIRLHLLLRELLLSLHLLLLDLSLDHLGIGLRLRRRLRCRIGKERIHVLMAGRTGQELGGIVEVHRRNQIGQPARKGLLLKHRDLINKGELFGFPAGPETDFHRHVVAFFPVPRVDRDPLAPELDGLGLLAMLPYNAMKENDISL